MFCAGVVVARRGRTARAARAAVVFPGQGQTGSIEHVIAQAPNGTQPRTIV